MAAHSSLLARRIPMDRGAWWAIKESMWSQRVRLDQLTLLLALERERIQPPRQTFTSHPEATQDFTLSEQLHGFICPKEPGSTHSGS